MWNLFHQTICAEIEVRTSLSVSLLIIFIPNVLFCSTYTYTVVPFINYCSKWNILKRVCAIILFFVCFIKPCQSSSKFCRDQTSKNFASEIFFSLNRFLKKVSRFFILFLRRIFITTINSFHLIYSITLYGTLWGKFIYFLFQIFLLFQLYI